jgi:hypothetical protein
MARASNIAWRFSGRAKSTGGWLVNEVAIAIMGISALTELDSCLGKLEARPTFTGSSSSFSGGIFSTGRANRARLQQYNEFRRRIECAGAFYFCHRGWDNSWLELRIERSAQS